MWTFGAYMIERIKLAKFNGIPCENLYGDLCYITREMFKDVIDLFNRVNSTMDNKNWLKFRDESYLQNVIDRGGFIIGCYVDETLVASALCESPDLEYTSYLVEMGLTASQIEVTYVSGYVMVDPLYRGNSLHRVLVEARIDASIDRDMKFIVTAIACENIFSLKTVLNLGFEIMLHKKNEYGIVRNILLKNLASEMMEEAEITA